MTNGVKVGVWTHIILYNIHDESCESARTLNFFSSHVSPKKPVDCGSLSTASTHLMGRPKLIIPWNASSHLLAYNGPTPNGQMDGWMNRWIIIAYNQYYSCVYSFMWACVWMNVLCEKGGGWPSCVITYGIDCGKYCVSPTRMDHLLGGYSLSCRWRAFFFYHLLGGYSLSHGWWRAFFFFFLETNRGEEICFLQNVSKRWEENQK